MSDRAIGLCCALLLVAACRAEPSPPPLAASDGARARVMAPRAVPLRPPGAQPDDRVIVPHARVINFKQLVFEGPVDLTATLLRIRAGERFASRDDGTVFQNREARLPA